MAPDSVDSPESILPQGFDIEGHRGARGLKPENTLPAFETALDLAHRLRGTSGSYGFKALSSELVRIERQLETLLGGTAYRADAWGVIADALRSAKAHLDSHAC